MCETLAHGLGYHRNQRPPVRGIDLSLQVSLAGIDNALNRAPGQPQHGSAEYGQKYQHAQQDIGLPGRGIEQCQLALPAKGAVGKDRFAHATGEPALHGQAHYRAENSQ
ncbi:hypothetical protein D3C77_474780 [compost metagenome]